MASNRNLHFVNCAAMSSVLNTLHAALAGIRTHTSFSPAVAIILGTGLGALADAITVESTLLYSDIPHMPASTVESHTGRLIFGILEGKSVVAMQGRFHLYEGYSAQEITFGVRLMHALGATTLLVANAAGGLNPLYRRGDLMMISDHINLQTSNPLTGVNEPSFGPRFPDMSEPYSNRLLAIGTTAALQHGVNVHAGVYVAVAGPNLETRAEYRFLRMVGGDAVGMSTVPEVIVARQLGMEVFGISIITDECDPDHLVAANIDEIIAAAIATEPALAAIVRRVCADC
jgi:purine-nucleoside phosphorylase